MVLTPNYLPTNQSEECPQADRPPHNLPPSPWKPLGSSGLLSTSCLDALLGACERRCSFLHGDSLWVD